MGALTYLFAFLTVGIAAGVAAVMKRTGYGARGTEATLAGAIVGLVVLFAVPSVPYAGMLVGGLVSLAASYFFYKR